MLCISSILNAGDDGMPHMHFCGSCGDFTAVLISHASIFLSLLLIGKINICKLRIQQLSVQYCIFVIPLYICYLNTEMFICDALHLGVGGWEGNKLQQRV